MSKFFSYIASVILFVSSLIIELALTKSFNSISILTSLISVGIILALSLVKNKTLNSILAILLIIVGLSQFTLLFVEVNEQSILAAFGGIFIIVAGIFIANIKKSDKTTLA